MKLVPVLIALFSLAATSSLLAQGCCGGGARPATGGCTQDTASATCGHAGHAAQPAANVRPPGMAKASLPQPVQAVFNEYIKVQSALAGDSIQEAKGAAIALVKAVHSDTDDLLPPKLSSQAKALTDAGDLAAARLAFKSLSDSLIQYLKDHNVSTEPYHEAYCGMAKAAWLQTGTTINNPYMGKEMPRCGEFKS